MIYVASSWRCSLQIAVVAGIRAAGLECYDFRHPEVGKEGFHWSDVGLHGYNSGENNPCDADDYVHALNHPTAQAGFDSDFNAMQKCDTCVLVLPCGRSAHLELGWFVGQGKRTAVLLDNPVIPELMYKMVDYITPLFFDLLGWLGSRGLTYHNGERTDVMADQRYVLMLNDMRSSNIENLVAVKVGTREELVAFHEGERVERYVDGRWGKTFRQGGPLEWFNSGDVSGDGDNFFGGLYPVPDHITDEEAQRVAFYKATAF